MKVDQMIIKSMMIMMIMMMTMIMVIMMIMMMIILSPYGIPMHQRAASKVGVHLYFIQEKLYIDSISTTTASYDCTALENISIVFFSEIAGCSKGNFKLLSEPLYIDAINFSFLQSCINGLSHSTKLIQYHIF